MSLQTKKPMSNDVSSVLRNSVTSIGGQFVILFAGLASSVLVARVLGKEQLGIFNWGLGLASMLMAIANAGIDNVIVRDVAQDKSKAPSYLLNGFIIKIVSSSFCCLGIILYLNIRHYTGIQLAVGYILCMTVITESFNYTCRSVLAALERQDLSVAVSVLSNFLRIAVIVLLVKLGYNIVAVAWTTVCGMLAMLIGQTVVIRRLVGGVGRPAMPTIKHLMRYGSTYLASTIFAGVFDRADFMMLEYFKGVAAVGIYSAPYRIMEIVTMIAYNISFALFPIISKRSINGSDEGSARVILRATRYLVILGIAICASIFLLSHQLIVMLYSNKYYASGTCLSILIWSRLITFAILPGQQAVQARNAQLLLVPPVIIRTLVNIGMNLYAIPRYGFLGACVSMVVSDNLYFALIYAFAFRGPERFSIKLLLGRVLFAAGLMAVIAWLAHPLGAIAATVLANIAFVFGLYAFRALDAEDKRFIGGVAKSIRYKVLSRG